MRLGWVDFGALCGFHGARVHPHQWPLACIVACKEDFIVAWKKDCILLARKLAATSLLSCLIRAVITCNLESICTSTWVFSVVVVFEGE